MTSLSTVDLADAYFNTRLNVKAWQGLSSSRKQLALNDSTRIIDLFNYIGWKTVDTQEHEWPRSGIYVDGILIPIDIIPEGILIAQYEIGFALAKGIDPEKEIRGFSVTSRRISSVGTTYDPKMIPEYLLLGIPSALAWKYLSPYLNRQASGTVKLNRVN